MDKLTYDDEYDFLIFKVDGIEYRSSDEVGDLVLDYGPAGVFSGFRLFNASKRLGITKKNLSNPEHWSCVVAMKGKSIAIDLSIGVAMAKLTETARHALPPTAISASA